MLELLTAPQNVAFTVALTIMLVIAFMEGVAMFLGAGLSEFVDALLPETEFDVDLDMDVDASAFSKFLGWLRVGRVPVLMLMIVFLTAFGLIGLTLQSFVSGIVGFYLPAWMAVVPAMALALPAVRIGGGALAAMIPNDETDAVSSDTFIGRVAVITLGTASKGSPAEAKLTDEHGHTHYIMVEPDEARLTFEQGSAVLLTEHHGAVFKGIVSRSEAMHAGH